MALPCTPLTHDQLDSLFEILIHKQLSTEIWDLQQQKLPTLQFLSNPLLLLQPSDENENENGNDKSPLHHHHPTLILYLLLETVLLPLPGYKELLAKFLTPNVQSLYEKLAACQISELDEPGTISALTNMGAIISAFLEYPAFLILRGLPEDERLPVRDNYNLNKATDLEEAWKVFLHKCIYDDQASDIIKRYANTGNINAQSSLVQAAYKYLVLNSAGVIQYTSFIPVGASHIVTSLIKTHDLLGFIYTPLKLALRWTSGSVMEVSRKIVLHEFGWINKLASTFNNSSSLKVPGFKTALQAGIFKLIGWDLGDIEKKTSTFKKANFKLISDKHWAALDAFANDPNIREQCRDVTAEAKTGSLVSGTFMFHKLDPVPSQYLPQLSNYLGLKLAIYNRLSILNIYCNKNDSTFLAVVNEISQSLMGVVQSIHTKIKLGTLVGYATTFLDGYAVIAKKGLVALHNSSSSSSSSSSSTLPNISEFVTLLEKNGGNIHKAIHALIKKSPDTQDLCKGYLNNMISIVHGQRKSRNSGLAARVTESVQAAYLNLSSSDREALCGALDQYTAYRKIASKEVVHELQNTMDGKASSHHRYSVFGRVTNLLDSIVLVSPPMQASGLNQANPIISILDGGSSAVTSDVRAYRKVVVGEKPPKMNVVSSIFEGPFLQALRENIRMESSS